MGTLYNPAFDKVLEGGVESEVSDYLDERISDVNELIDSNTWMKEGNRLMIVDEGRRRTAALFTYRVGRRSRSSSFRSDGA